MAPNNRTACCAQRLEKNADRVWPRHISARRVRGGSHLTPFVQSLLTLQRNFSGSLDKGLSLLLLLVLLLFISTPFCVSHIVTQPLVSPGKQTEKKKQKRIGGGYSVSVIMLWLLVPPPPSLLSDRLKIEDAATNFANAVHSQTTTSSLDPIWGKLPYR